MGLSRAVRACPTSSLEKVNSSEFARKAAALSHEGSWVTQQRLNVLLQQVRPRSMDEQTNRGPRLPPPRDSRSLFVAAFGKQLNTRGMPHDETTGELSTRIDPERPAIDSVPGLDSFVGAARVARGDVEEMPRSGPDTPEGLARGYNHPATGEIASDFVPFLRPSDRGDDSEQLKSVILEKLREHAVIVGETLSHN